MPRRPPLAAKLALGLVAAIQTLTPTTSRADEPSFTLSCRGGAGMTVRVWADDDLGWTHVDVFFQRAAQGASQQLPGASQCAWLDRALAADEPVHMSGFFRGVRMIVDIQGDRQLRGYDFAGTERAKADRLRAVLDKLWAGEPFLVEVRAKGSGASRYFEIVRFGP